MATEIFDFDGAGERYKFLLQPVKNLASNWDLDIAKTLEDYIRRVVDENDSAVLVDQNGHRKIFNFAEAAMLIHGTTTVYVKKVEYVLQIAQNFFDQLKEDNRPEKQKRRKGIDGEIENGEGAEGENGEDAENEDPEQRAKKRKPKVKYTTMRHFLEKFNHYRAQYLPLVPIAFVPLSDFEKSDVTLYTRTNQEEQIGKKDDFRVNTCHIYESIALLDIMHIDLIDKFSLPQLPDPPQERQQRSTAGVISGFNTQLEPLMERTLEEDTDEQHPLGAGLWQNEATSNEVNAMEVDHLDPVEIVTELSKSCRTDPSQERQEQSTAGIISGFNTQLEPLMEQTLEEVTDEQHSLGTGLWQNEATSNEVNAMEVDLLDPMEIVTELSKPYRKRTNCVTDAAKQIKARERRIERECRERGVPNERSVKTYIDTQMYRRRIKKRAFALGQFNSFLMDQAVLALNPLIYDEEKRRTDLRKKRRKELQACERAKRAAHRASRQTLDPVLDHPNDEDDENEPTLVGAEITNGEKSQEQQIAVDDILLDNDNDVDDFEDENLFDGNGDLDPEAHDDSQNLGDVLDVEELENSLGLMNMYAGFEHLVSSKRRGPNALASKLSRPIIRNAYDDTVIFDRELDLLSERPPSQMGYDEIIAYHLRKYWTASEAAISKFSERIQLWEAKMTVVLEQEQKYRNFDTGQYGDELLDRFDNRVGAAIDFENILDTLPDDYDRSRYLLVSLILANQGKLDIETTNPQVDDFADNLTELPDQQNVHLIFLQR